MTEEFSRIDLPALMALQQATKSDDWPTVIRIAEAFLERFPEHKTFLGALSLARRELAERLRSEPATLSHRAGQSDEHRRTGVLGHDLETGEPVIIGSRERLQGTYIIGRTGTGKSSLLEDLIIRDIDDGAGLCVLDPDGDLVDNIQRRVSGHRREDIVLLDPGNTEWPFGLNLFWCEDQSNLEETSRRASHFVELFEKLWGPQGSEGTSWGPRIPMILRNTAYALLANPGHTMAEIPELLGEHPGFRERLLVNLTDPYLRQFWEDYQGFSRKEKRDLADSTSNKLDEFLSQRVVRNIVGQSQTTADFRKFMDTGKVVLVPLRAGRLGERVAILLGTVIVLQILNSALSRADMPTAARTTFNLYVDEYQMFATPAFAKLLTQGRKYGIATTFAHQTRAQLDHENRAAAVNADTIVSFAVVGEDAEELAKQFNRTPPKPEASGRQQTLVFAQNPVQHLTQHKDKVVQQIGHGTTIRIMLEIERGEHNSPPDANLGTRLLTRAYDSSVREGLRLMNRYLTGMMDGSIREESKEQVEAIRQILIELREYFHIGPYMDTAFDGDRHYVVRRPAGLDAKAMEFLICASIADHRLDNPSESTANFISEKPRRTAENWGKDYDADAVRASLMLAYLGRTLAKEPIRENSGMWETTYDRPRAYSDVEAEIASKLVSQPKFQALCRVTVSGEPKAFSVATPSFFLVDEAHASGAAEGLTVRAVAEGICRSREDVETELAVRSKAAKSGDPSDDEGPRRIVRRPESL